MFSLLLLLDPYRCILATDMTRHNEILSKFKSILPVFDFNNKEHKDVVRTVMDGCANMRRSVFLYGSNVLLYVCDPRSS